MLGASVVGRRPGKPANRRRNSASHLPTFRDLKAWKAAVTKFDGLEEN